MPRFSICKRCSGTILWARQAGGKKWHPLEPEIIGDPKPSDFPLNVYNHEEGTCTLVNVFQQYQLTDMSELHRRHVC